MCIDNHYDSNRLQYAYTNNYISSYPIFAYNTVRIVSERMKSKKKKKTGIGYTSVYEDDDASETLTF